MDEYQFGKYGRCVRGTSREQSTIKLVEIAAGTDAKEIPNVLLAMELRPAPLLAVLGFNENWQRPITVIRVLPSGGENYFFATISPSSDILSFRAISPHQICFDWIVAAWDDHRPRRSVVIFFLVPRIPTHHQNP